ncbi:DUF3099 domain-containing protein [Gordonia sp. WA4-43]|uniref:DUF3099 domain-containing protein n=1 Tax=Gordonia sp. WA4-43 TaxID=2878678 RepID=UPI001CFA5527|nr:DUF3099 domain-containing protein [Gordonia sp. WA4-43]UCZ90411.1 DUF3099 domain-containing protein [Gordonia sp. WA4-43]
MGESGRGQQGRNSTSPHVDEHGHPASKRPGAEAYLITDAPDSLEAQHRARVRKYLFLMAFRVPALAIAGIAYGITGSGLLALAIVAISIPLPWAAVLIANDRPPRKRGEVPQYKYGADHHVVGPPALTDTGTDHQLSRTIDGQVVDPDDPRA